MRDSAQFLTTQWTVVLSAAHGSEERRQAALAGLCQNYWKPIYAWLRKRGHGPEAAQDLTQEFFLRLLQKEWLTSIEQTGGRFRSFLLTLVQRFAANQYDLQQTQKRGGKWQQLSFDWHEGESIALSLATPELSPDQTFDQLWAHQVIDQAIARVEAEALSSTKAVLWPHLKPLLATEPGLGGCERIANITGVTANYVSVSLGRWRRRVREMVRDVLRDTVSSEAALDEEFATLLEIIRQGASLKKS